MLKINLKELRSVIKCNAIILTCHWLSCTGDHTCRQQYFLPSGWHIAWTRQQESLCLSEASEKDCDVLHALSLILACWSFGAVYTSLLLPIFDNETNTYAAHTHVW